MALLCKGWLYWVDHELSEDWNDKEIEHVQNGIVMDVTLVMLLNNLEQTGLIVKETSWEQSCLNFNQCCGKIKMQESNCSVLVLIKKKEKHTFQFLFCSWS